MNNEPTVNLSIIILSNCLFQSQTSIIILSNWLFQSQTSENMELSDLQTRTYIRIIETCVADRRRPILISPIGAKKKSAKKGRNKQNRQNKKQKKQNQIQKQQKKQPNKPQSVRDEMWQPPRVNSRTIHWHTARLRRGDRRSSGCWNWRSEWQ